MRFLIKLMAAILLLSILWCFDQFGGMLSQGQPGRLEATINGRR